MANRYAELLERNPVVGAPLADVTDYPFRRIQRQFTDGLIHAEMVAVHGILNDSEKTWRMIETVPIEEGPIGVQILGSDDCLAARSVDRIMKVRPAFIDINMGCPVKKVLKSNCGAALLDVPELAAQMVRAVKEETDLPVGVKVRLGRERITVDEVIPALADAGAEAVTVHGRTAQQLYRGPADKEKVISVAQQSPIPVIASGDVFTADDVRYLLSNGVSGVLAARGMMGSPWFLKEAYCAARGIEPPPRPSRRALMLEHLEFVLEFYGPEGIKKFRRHLVEYARGIPEGARYRHELVTAKTSERLREVISTIED